MRLVRWIVIRNGNDTRLVTRRPSLDLNEVAVRVTIDAPSPPRIVGEVTITLPEPPPTAVAIEYGEDETA